MNRRNIVLTCVIVLLSLSIGMVGAAGENALIGLDQSQDMPNSPGAAVPDAFTYQGYLEEGSAPANGLYDFKFTRYGDPLSGSPIGSTRTFNNVQVSNGLFIVNLNFGNYPVFDEAVYLQIEVRPGDSTGSYTLLSDRQLITPSPFAKTAEKVVGLDGGAMTIGSKTGTLLQFAGRDPYGDAQLNGGFGLVKGDNFLSPIIWMYGGTGNVFQVKEKGFSTSVEAGTLLMQVDVNGNTYVKNQLGIGIQSPQSRLHVYNDSATGQEILIEDPDAGQSAGLVFKNTANTWEIGGDSNPDVFFIDLLGSGQNALAITPSSQVGIGTNTPSGRLTVYGTTAEDWLSGIQLLRQGGGDGRIVVDGYGMKFRTPIDGDNFYFRNDENDTILEIKDNGTTVTKVLQITGGDLAEPFEIAGAENVKPGYLVAIDPENPGQLRIADGAYDHMVAGCISGANGLYPGVLMYREKSEAENAHPVALSGRVYCWADATYGAIQPGDLLTSSATPGHVMTVGDYEQAQGAIIGKAMSALEDGLGLILVLVSLQ